jgi:uncharacterized protein
MSHMIFVNLPVKDLSRSKDFFGKLGFNFNPQFTDDTAASMIISDGSIYAMLLTHAKWKEFTDKEIPDTKKYCGVMNALSMESRDAVQALFDKAIAAGATETRPPADYGFMYQRSFDDLDGHTWELVWMDMSKMQ